MSSSGLVGDPNVGRSPVRERRTVIGFHLSMRLADDRPIATTDVERRVVVRVVLARGENRGLLGFGSADNHLHAALVTDRATAGAFAHVVEIALQHRLLPGVPFEPVRIRPFQDQRHAYNAFHYVQRQDSRHDLGIDALREGTSIPDLLGLRILESSFLRAQVRRCLPRVRREDLVKHLPCDPFDETIPIALDLLAEAAAAAFALPDFLERSAEATRARRAAVQAAARSVPSDELAARLGVGVRAVQAARAAPFDEEAIRAIRGQARLRFIVRARRTEP